jgi:hypothetical protein
MIREFALEPDAITSSYREFCYFAEKYGVGQGRVISEFPRKWRRMVCEAAQRHHAGKVELTKIVERLRLLGSDVVFDSGRPGGDGTTSWMDRALVEHARKPFDAIIARENASAHPDILVSAELDDANPRFQAAGQRHINRTAADIVASVELLLRASQTIKLVDPHFNPSTPRWRRMLGLILNILGGSSRTGITLEIHRADNALPGNIQHYFDSAIPTLRPQEVSVNVFLHPEKGMHNRFVLTELGGASFSTGLDDNEDGGYSQTDLVALLAAGTYAKEWKTYSGHAAFRVYP